MIIRNCISHVIVTQLGPGSTIIGGVVGSLYGYVSPKKCVAQNCLNYGLVLESNMTSFAIGGIVGGCTFGTIVNCMNLGEIKLGYNEEENYSQVGTILRTGFNSKVMNCY